MSSFTHHRVIQKKNKCTNITKAANLTVGTGQACIAIYCKTRTLHEMSYTYPELPHYAV